MDIVGYVFQDQILCSMCMADAMEKHMDVIAPTFGGGHQQPYEDYEDYLDRVGRDWFGFDRGGPLMVLKTDQFPRRIEARDGIALNPCEHCGGKLVDYGG